MEKKHNDSQETRYYLLALLKEELEFQANKLIHVDGTAFGIHGLWSQISPTIYLSYCRIAKFVAEKIASIKPILMQYWHSSQGSDENFWAHEWLKHGTCAYPILDEEQFFSKTIELYQQVAQWHKQGTIHLMDYYSKSKRMFLIPFDLTFQLMKLSQVPK